MDDFQAADPGAGAPDQNIIAADRAAGLTPIPAPSEAPLADQPTAYPASSPVFFGRFGLRAGYGIAIFVVAVIFIMAFAQICAIAASGQMGQIMAARSYAQAHPQAPHPPLAIRFTPIMPLIMDGVTFAALFGLGALFSRAERRPLRSYGVGSYRLADLVPGAAWGLAIMAALIAVLRAGHWLVFDGQNVHGAAILTYGAAWLAAFFCVGLSEEYTFRGYVQFTLMRGVWGLAERLSATHTRAFAFWIAATFWSAMFGVVHMGNGGENAFGLLQVFLAGITFAYALWRTGSLWWGIGFHMTWDWAQSFLFGVADSGNISIGRLFVTHPQGRPLLSGGTDGPEGSIFATVALLLTIAVIRFTTRPGQQPAIEPEPEALPAPATGFHNALA